MNKIDIKKGEERFLIEKARRHSALFPKSKLSASESPDWLLEEAQLGIEVSWLFSPKTKKAFEGAEVSEFQKKVVDRARESYLKFSNVDVDVLVFFDNQWTQKHDIEENADSIARIVLKNLPTSPGDCHTVADRDTDDWAEGVSTIRVCRGGHEWKAAGSSHIAMLNRDFLAKRIAQKNGKVSQYRLNRPGFRLWLLLATKINVLVDLNIPPEISEWEFEFSFDRVFVLPWNGDLIEVRRSTTLAG